MSRCLAFVPLLALLVLCGCAGGPGASNLSVRTTGDARVYGVYTAGGWR